jgi:uncharacterized membrane protein YfcA
MQIALMLVGGLLATCGFSSLRNRLFHGDVGRLSWPKALMLGLVGSALAIVGAALTGR